VEVRVANAVALFAPATSPAGGTPGVLDGLLDGASALPPPSVEAFAVPLIGPDTAPITLHAPLALDPAAPGSAAAGLTLPAGAPGARQSVYFLVLRANAQAGAPARGADPLALWAAAPMTPAPPAPVTPDDPPGSIDDLPSAP
jgi:hypothetical protein